LKERILALAVLAAVIFACEVSRGEPIRHTTACHWSNPIHHSTECRWLNGGQVIYYYPNSRSVYDANPWFSDSFPSEYWLHVSLH
jgi:hypothetical protein